MSCEQKHGWFQPIFMARSAGMAWIQVLSLSIGALALGGCGEKTVREAPPTYPVTGQVKVPNGSLPVGGCIEFRPKGNEDELAAMGIIDSNGRFTLSIPYADRVIAGATAGPHEVWVVMPLDAASRTPGGRVSIPGVFTVSTHAENNFTITMPNNSR